MLRRVTLIRIGVSEELGASFIRVKRIGELGTTLAVTSNRRTNPIRKMSARNILGGKSRPVLKADNLNANCVRFLVFTAVTMKNVVFWDVTYAVWLL
jgi:hypothetical protein